MKAAILFACLLIPATCRGQQSKIITPTTAGDLRQLCKSFQLVALESDLKKAISWQDVTASTSCVNFIMGIVHTVISLDVGYYPEVKLEMSDLHKDLSFREAVTAIMAYLDSHSEHLKEPPAPVVLAALMDAKIITPVHWTKEKK